MSREWTKEPCKCDTVIRSAISRGLRIDGNQVVLPSGKPIQRTYFKGRARVSLGPSEKRVSILYARIVLWLSKGEPPPEGRFFVDHIDNNPGNDDPSNLRWVTPKENSENMSERGRAVLSSTMREKNARMTTEQRRRAAMRGLSALPASDERGGA